MHCRNGSHANSLFQLRGIKFSWLDLLVDRRACGGPLQDGILSYTAPFFLPINSFLGKFHQPYTSICAVGLCARLLLFYIGPAVMSEVKASDSDKNVNIRMEKRDGETYVALGLFIVAAGLPVAAGTYWAAKSD